MKISAAQLNSVHLLWDELADFPITQTDAALVHLFQKICGWINAGNGLWVGGVRIGNGSLAPADPAHGWRGRVVRQLMQTPLLQEKTKLAVQQQDKDPGMTTRALTARAGVFRMQRLHDGFIDIKAFKATVHYQMLYERVGITDRMWVVFPINEDVESYFVFDRFRSSQRFSVEEMDLAAYALRGIKWFHRNMMLSHGLQIVKTPLTKIERQILHLLLTDKSEKEMAAALGQSLGTTHKYITGIFRKLGVKGRAGLTALWLDRR